MERYNCKYKAKYTVQLTAIKSLKQCYLGDSYKASVTIDTLHARNLFESQELLNIKLVRVMIHFLSGELIEAKDILTKFYHNDRWYEQKAGLAWLLQKKHIEILLHIELGNSDYVASRIVSLQRKYNNLLDTKKDAHIITFLKLIKRYAKDPAIVTTKAFKSRVEKSFDWKSAEEEDIILMSLYAWLSAKMEERRVYDVVLELVSATRG
ncbi:MAG: hypothetical protein ACI865_003385 [Flavobacteriaceae bacterium]|jgi:hypothetical protein